MGENRPLIPLGVVFLAVGLGIGFLMISQPQGLNPSWPLGAAMLVPVVFAFGGLHLLASGLGLPRVSAAMLRGILLGFWAIANWAAFFSARSVPADRFLLRSPDPLAVSERGRVPRQPADPHRVAGRGRGRDPHRGRVAEASKPPSRIGVIAAGVFR